MRHFDKPLNVMCNAFTSILIFNMQNKANRTADKMKIVAFFFLPSLLFGQTNESNLVAKPPMICNLKSYQTKDDTTHCFCSVKCQIINYPKTANGIWKVNGRDSTLIEVSNLINGNFNGSYISYYSNGKSKCKAYYEQGKLHGEYISYHNTGFVYKEGCYVYNSFSGVEKYYWNNGTLKMLLEWKNGSTDSHKWKYWDKEGNSISEEKYYEIDNENE
jgi:hypothetical protein